MYVVRCADGSLYTGYTTNVERRVAAHNAGKGAKFTRARRPVSLVASVRFFTSQRAMSAEAHFKQLTRAEKDTLLNRALKGEALEAVLAQSLPGFSEEPLVETIAASLLSRVDEAYRAFQLPLMPSVDPTRMLGVRTPELRRIAKEVAPVAINKKTGKPTKQGREFFRALPHTSFEEMQVHSFLIARLKDYDSLVEQYARYLDYVDNWASCDQLATAPLMQQPERTFALAQDWLQSPKPYVVRFGVLVLMRHFLDAEYFSPQLFTVVAQAGSAVCGWEALQVLPSPKPSQCKAASGNMQGFAKEAQQLENGSIAHPLALPKKQPFSKKQTSPKPPDPLYYVCMARAWFYAEAFAKQPQAALEWFREACAEGALDMFTVRKTIQKACESRKVAPSVKEALKALRP
jgi:predicted GIY-YIG superfamily endonuclease/3-methyladenine DNA glycosylase AlkD